MNRYDPEGLPRAAALAGAVALTSLMLAGVQQEAASARPAQPVAAVFTGEVVAAGPVYRLPGIEVSARRPIALATPARADRAAFRNPARDQRAPDV